MGASKGIKKHFEIIGTKIGVLFVKELRRKDGRTKAFCICDCGNERECEIIHLIRNTPNKCNCKIASRCSIIGEIGRKHSGSNTRLYGIWENARQRCRNYKSKSYQRYGGRGISFTTEWDNFLIFKEWAEKNGYLDGLTLDRINNNGNYDSNNCRWATPLVQGSNTSKNRKVEYNGQKIHVSELARRFGVTRGDILYHLNKGENIYEIENWFKKPKLERLQNKKMRIFSDKQILDIRKLSKNMSYKQLSNMFNCSYTTISRIVKGTRYKTVDEKLNLLKAL